MGHLDDVLGLWPAGAAGPSPFEATAANEMERKLEAALASLAGDVPRSAAASSVWRACSRSRPAAVCGISPESLRQRLHRARSLLSRRMETCERDPPARGE
jgi:DNA-directed RNA polymerase specialized sigma24 family protein